MDYDGILRFNHVRKGSWYFRSFVYIYWVFYPDIGHGGSYSGYYDYCIGIMQINEVVRVKNVWWLLYMLVWRKFYRLVIWGFWVLGNNSILDCIGWNIQSNFCMIGCDTVKGWMKVSWRTYIYGEE